MNPNKQQEKLVNGLEGCYIVDAGAGTGKTFTITERYVSLLENTDPEDIFLATFTRNAADEMSQRIADRSSYKASKIFNAPISTFHSHCQGILSRNGFDVPQLLGLSTELDNVDPLESKIRERQYFEDFYRDFMNQRPEYIEFYGIINEPSDLLGLIKSLASKGVIPSENGWFEETGDHLDGDYKEFRKLFKELNRPRDGKNGNKKQSILRQRLYSYNYKELPDNAPDYEEIAGDYGCKKIRMDFCKKAFKESRENLKEFVHDIYFEYLEYSLRNSYLNFSFLMALTLVTLYEKDSVREKERFKYIMIDEFQDTNEIQLKISLLLADEPNICVVGDWKQSIYSFQYADIDNIKMFNKRMNRNIKELNSDKRRVNFDSVKVDKIELKKNYRSTQKILNESEQSFRLKGNQYENVRKPDIVSLESARESDSEVKKLLCSEEKINLLAKIQDLVDNPDYTYEGRKLDYSDIAVISRTRRFGLNLQKEAEKYGIPASYEGGIELFNTSEAKTALAWLRALNGSKKGWAVILERTGYNVAESEKLIEDLPENLLDFRKELKATEGLEGKLRKIFRRHGYENPVTEKIIDVLRNTFKSSYMTRSDIVSFIEENIEEKEIYEIDSSTGNSVQIQTVHGAKGLEYPAVFVADVNDGRFPSRNGNYTPIIFDDILGLRQRKIYDDDNGYVFDNWRSEILSKCIGSSYDEERRLMYVAMTRAENYLYISAEKDRESHFYHDLELEEHMLNDEPEEVEIEEEKLPILEVGRPSRSRKRIISTSKKIEMDKERNGNTEHGQKLHRFLEEHIKNSKKPETEKERKITEKIENFKGDLRSEVPFKLPKDGAVIEGRIDLLAVSEKEVQVVDLKTSDNFSDEASEQLEIYREAIEKIYPDKKIITEILEV